jgi:hypothetical protein
MKRPRPTAARDLEHHDPGHGDTWDVFRPRRAIALFIAAFLVLPLSACGGSDEPSQSEKLQAIGQAQVAFQQARVAGQDLSAGPCIAETLPAPDLSDWVADIAHDPRQPVDDQPQNQCQRFRNGEAHHFVELSPTGQLIRAE